MIEIVRERGVDFRESQMRMLAMDFIRRPAIFEVVQDYLRNTNPRYALQSRWLAGVFLNMWVD